MLRQFHDCIKASYKIMESSLKPLRYTNGVKQVCVIEPTLFSIMFSVVLMDAFQDSDTGFRIRCRFDGNIFNLYRRLQDKTKMQADVRDELLYADDMDKNALAFLLSVLTRVFVSIPLYCPAGLDLINIQENKIHMIYI